MAVTTNRVIKHFYIFKHVLASLLAIQICTAFNSLALEELKKALDDRVVIAISTSAHAGD